MSATWRVNNSTALGGEVCSPWQANHAYSLGARCVCTGAYATTAARAVVFECTTAGTSHATTQPTWDYTVGNTTSDGTVTWTARSPSDGSWDNASCYLMYVANHASADDDTIYVDDGHSEAYATANFSIIGSVTPGVFKKIICVDKATDNLSTGAIISTGTKAMALYYNIYSYGVLYQNVSSSTITINSTSTYPTHCILEGNNTDVLRHTGTASVVVFVIGSSATTDKSVALSIINGNINLPDKDTFIRIHSKVMFLWSGGKFVGTEGKTGLITASAIYGRTGFEIRDVDFDDIGNGEAATSIFYVGDTISNYDISLLRCKLPSDAGFTVVDGDFAYSTSGRIRLRHCSAGNRYYDFWEKSPQGVVEDETTIIRTGGASDGTTGISCKMVSSAGCVENIIALESIPITGWTSSTTEKTFTVEFVHDSATALQNDEIWMELEYPANNTDGLGAIAKSKCAVLGTPADTTDSSETWTTTGLTNPNTRKLSVTVTPGKAGPICARVYLAKASTTVYVDLMITES